MNLLAGINKRYDIMMASKTEQSFYLNAYQYYDYIFTNPKLAQIYSEGGRAYRLKATDIWDGYDKTDLEKCSHQTQLASKMESADMLCNGCALEVRLYRPLKHYYETSEPDMLQDPYMVAIVKGIDYASKVCSQRYGGYRENKKDIVKGFNNWFKNQREYYEQELSIFHVQFINEIEKLEKPQKNKVLIKTESKPFLDLDTGDFTYLGKEGNFPTSGQEFKVLNTLLNSPHHKASYTTLVNSYGSVSKASKVDKARLYIIVRNIKRELGVLPKNKHSNTDPFNAVRNEGYRLEI